MICQAVGNQSQMKEGQYGQHKTERFTTFLRIQRPLEERGHRLQTHCDTEVLPHLYEEHGIDFVAHIDGMFAVAIWDDEDKVGLLARDRMGKKPLYYCLHDGALFFASEIKALLRLPGFERRLNLEALHHYLSFKHVPHPSSIFSGIAVLPPAHLLTYRPGREPSVPAVLGSRLFRGRRECRDDGNRDHRPPLGSSPARGTTPITF